MRAAVLVFLIGLPLPCLAAGEMVRLYDFGADEMGYLSLPEKPPVGSVLLIPEAYGSRQVVQQRCDLFAKLGYVALAVDLYNGNVSDNPLVAVRMQRRLDEELAVKAVEAGLRLLYESPRYKTGKVLIGVWGQNLPATVQAASNLENFSPSSITWIEPRELSLMAKMESIGAPLQVVMRSELDTPALDRTLLQFSRAQGMAAEVYRYEDQLGFMLEPSPSKNAVEAWSSVIDFWKEIIEGHYQPTVPAGWIPSKDSLPDPTTKRPEAPPSREQVPREPKSQVQADDRDPSRLHPRLR